MYIRRYEYISITGSLIADIALYALLVLVVLLVKWCVVRWPKFVYLFAARRRQIARAASVGKEGRLGYWHSAVFELQDGSSMTLPVTGREYTEIPVGQMGWLTWKGKCFVSFEPVAEEKRPDGMLYHDMYE
jgi:hypothetical protein